MRVIADHVKTEPDRITACCTGCGDNVFTALKTVFKGKRIGYGMKGILLKQVPVSLVISFVYPLFMVFLAACRSAERSSDGYAKSVWIIHFYTGLLNTFLRCHQGKLNASVIRNLKSLKML